MTRPFSLINRKSITGNSISETRDTVFPDCSIEKMYFIFKQDNSGVKRLPCLPVMFGFWQNNRIFYCSYKSRRARLFFLFCLSFNALGSSFWGPFFLL